MDKIPHSKNSRILFGDEEKKLKYLRPLKITETKLVHELWIEKTKHKIDHRFIDEDDERSPVVSCLAVRWTLSLLRFSPRHRHSPPVSTPHATCAGPMQERKGYHGLDGSGPHLYALGL